MISYCWQERHLSLSLPALSHHTLAAAVGALRPVRRLGEQVPAARPGTLPDTLPGHRRVVVPVMTGQQQPGVGGEVRGVAVVSGGGRVGASCIRCGREWSWRKWRDSRLISGWDISSVCSRLENEDDVRQPGQSNSPIVNIREQPTRNIH